MEEALGNGVAETRLGLSNQERLDHAAGYTRKFAGSCDGIACQKVHGVPILAPFEPNVSVSPTMKPSPVPERERLSARKQDSVRLSIGEQATRLFLEKGYEATTVDDIAAVSGIGRRTFFRYFKTKEDVLLWGFDQFAHTVIERLALKPRREHPLSALRHALLDASIFFGQQPEQTIRVLLLTERTPALYNQQLAQQDRWKRWFADALRKRKKYADGSLVPELTANFALEAMKVATQRWIKEPKTSLLDHVVRAFAAMEKVLNPKRN